MRRSEKYMGRLPRLSGVTKMILRRPPRPLFRYLDSRPVEKITGGRSKSLVDLNMFSAWISGGLRARRKAGGKCRLSGSGRRVGNLFGQLVRPATAYGFDSIAPPPRVITSAPRLVGPVNWADCIGIWFRKGAVYSGRPQVGVKRALAPVSKAGEGPI